VTLIPAVFMTAVVVSYILIAPEGFSLSHNFSYTLAALVAFSLFAGTLFYFKKHKMKTVEFAS
jgi:branched-subunit amino acid transport protein